MLGTNSPSSPHIQHHGNTSGVTGSCHHYMLTDDSHYLIDCGFSLGGYELGKLLARPTIEFDISEVTVPILSHKKFGLLSLT